VSLFGIILSLVVLMALCFRGANLIVLAPFAALLAVLFDQGMPILATYTQIFMPAVGRFIANYLPLFLLGSLFGKWLEVSGSTAVIARSIGHILGEQRALLSIVLACTVLTYGGVSLFVVVFAVYPLAVELLRAANVPKRLLPGAIALGSFSYTMTATPGSLQIQNLIPMKFFGTTGYASPGLGLIGAAIMFVIGMAWLNWRARRAAAAGEGYGAELKPTTATTSEERPLPHLVLAILPIVAVMTLNFFCSQYLLLPDDHTYLADKKFGATTLEAVRGVWATILAMTAGLGLILVLHWPRRRELLDSLGAGATAALLPIMNTASEVGYGATIAALSGFTVLRNSIFNIAPHNALVGESITINLLSGITGSASGGLTIALEALGPTILATGTAQGISPELLHRIASMSCSGLDAMPHNGAVITLLLICGLTHRQSYLDVFMTAVVGPLVATAIALVLGTMFGGF
jgi:H+/gluconate symporter-like permease